MFVCNICHRLRFIQGYFQTHQYDVIICYYQKVRCWMVLVMNLRFFCDLLVGKYKQLVPFPRVKGGDSPGRRNEIHLGMQ